MFEPRLPSPLLFFIIYRFSCLFGEKREKEYRFLARKSFFNASRGWQELNYRLFRRFSFFFVRLFSTFCRNEGVGGGEVWGRRRRRAQLSLFLLFLSNVFGRRTWQHQIFGRYCKRRQALGFSQQSIRWKIKSLLDAVRFFFLLFFRLAISYDCDRVCTEFEFHFLKR